MSLDPLKCTFLGDHISAHRGCCALIFLHALEIDQTLQAHTPTGTGVPQNFFNRENSKFGLKFSVYTSIISSELMGIPSQTFIQTTCREPGVITCVQFLEGVPPKIWEGQKTVQFFSRFLTTFNFDREYLHKLKIGKVVDQLQPLPRWAKKVFELWSTNEKYIDVSIDPP